MVTEEDVDRWLARQNAVLIGKPFDIKQQEGREEFKAWFMSILEGIDAHRQNE